jgi:hypothetical protein
MLVVNKPSALIAWLDFPILNKIRKRLPAVFISLKESFEVALRLEVWPSMPCSNSDDIKRKEKLTLPSTNNEKENRWTLNVATQRYP